MRIPIQRLGVKALSSTPVTMTEKVPPPPPPLLLDTTAKAQLGILMLSNFLVQMGIGMLIVTLPVFAESLGLGAAGVGLLIAVPQLTKLLFNLPVGHLVDVRGRKPFLIVGAILDGLGQFATAASSTIFQLVPARLLIGVGTAVGSVTGPATMAYTQDVVSRYPDHSGFLLGALQAVGFLAFCAGPAIGGVIAERAGPAVPFIIFGGLQMATAPMKMLLPETLPAENRTATSSVGFRGLWKSTSDSMGGMIASYRALLADRRQQALLGMKFAFLCGLSLILTVVPLQAAAAWGATAADLGKLYSFVTLLCLVFSPMAGVLADRIGAVPLAIGGSVATALSVACIPLCRSQALYCLARSLWGVGEAFLITAYSALALDVTPEAQRGARNSLDNQFSDVALLFVPLLVGLVGAKSHAGAFWLASGLMLVANGAVATLLRP